MFVPSEQELANGEKHVEVRLHHSVVGGTGESQYVLAVRPESDVVPDQLSVDQNLVIIFWQRLRYVRLRTSQLEPMDFETLKVVTVGCKERRAGEDCRCRNKAIGS